jgi:sorbose reductase
MKKIVHQVYDDLGPVGGIVCNAGQAAQKPALEATREDFDACFDTNVWGAFVSAQACAALWKEHGYQNGKVVIVSCESVIIGIYVGSKWIWELICF